ncbi:piggyBac transposable element-derived protein 3 [Trichonephila clavipes]|nr:piggyBac transposable element-derived protein 3 [Trichonephila clavipes]
MGKMSPFYAEFGKKFQRFVIFHSKLSVDELRVPYYSHHSDKMFIKGKRLDLDIKYGCCVSEVTMRIDCGKKTKIENSPLGSRVVWEL